MNLNLKPYFQRKKIIHSTRYKPGVLVHTFQHGGKKYVRITFPNLIKYQGMMPVTDVLFSDVVGVRHLPSRFEKWFYGLLGKKPRGKFYMIERNVVKQKL